jgi:hypothetical protein
MGNFMNPAEITHLARKLDFANEEHSGLRVIYGVACINRVRHLLTDAGLLRCLDAGNDFCDGNAAVSVGHGVAAALVDERFASRLLT